MNLRNDIITRILIAAETGVSSASIAADLGLSVRTVKTVRRRDWQLKRALAERGKPPKSRRRKTVWCDVCRCWVFPPCVACGTRAAIAEGIVTPGGTRDPMEPLTFKLEPKEESRRAKVLAARLAGRPVLTDH